VLIVSLRADWLAWGSVFFRTKPSSGSLESNSRYAMTPAATSNPYTSRRYVSLILSANEDTVALVLGPDPLIAFSSASLCAWSAPKFQKLKTMKATAVRKASGTPRFSRNAAGFLQKQGRQR
jgi:hypothetical protein